MPSGSTPPIYRHGYIVKIFGETKSAQSGRQSALRIHVTHIRTWAQTHARANTHLTPKAHLEEVELLALLGVLFLYQLIDQLPHIPVPVCFCLPRMDTDR